ncbi:type IV pilus twitching motility protein PilT [Photobacterium kishitanii]|uniref:Bacterial type II secretion system protein E domain-containing protein n=1 Tax=Photobacterium kishitanii TaxID=318456 RepID=A0A2T3KN35_9GAMM|nr:ATPase, T2SS/T4P/T4SS family [Photobacterium kishitanii]PSV01184.1 hypothetical protein C9J27_03940 [Photobacterium kishitanii]
MNGFYSRESVHYCLGEAIEKGATEIHVNEGDFVKFEIGGRIIKFSEHRLDTHEVANFCNTLYKSETGTSIVISGSEIDHEFEFKYLKKDEKVKKSRTFRVNSAAATVSSIVCPSITIRVLSETPPPWGKYGYEQEIWDAWRPESGLILIGGSTGSGKSTLLASGIRRILSEMNDEKIVTLESPIEYNLKPYEKENTIVVQRSVPKNTKTFKIGLESSLRQNPTIIVVGESRDAETIRTVLLACQTGHLVYTTTHVNSVAETIPRMLSEFPVNEHHTYLSALLYNTRMIINQKIVKSLDGGVVGLREFLVITPEIRDRLEFVPLLELKKIMRKLVNARGQSFYKHALRYYKEGLLDKKEIDRLRIENEREME